MEIRDRVKKRSFLLKRKDLCEKIISASIDFKNTTFRQELVDSHEECYFKTLNKNIMRRN